MSVCKCGCNKEVPFFKKRGRKPRLYIKGHLKKSEVSNNKNLIKEMYYEKKLCMNDIAKSLNTSRQTIAYYMNLWGFDRRKNIDAMRLKNKQNGRIYGPNWKGGSWYSKAHNTWWTYTPKHPKSNHSGAVPTHILVAEKRLDRYLGEDEIVHHLDENRSNNSPKNLCVMSRSDHMKIHRILGQVGISAISNGDLSIIKLIQDSQYRELIKEIYINRKPIV